MVGPAKRLVCTPSPAAAEEGAPQQRDGCHPIMQNSSEESRVE